MRALSIFAIFLEITVIYASLFIKDKSGHQSLLAYSGNYGDLLKSLRKNGAALGDIDFTHASVLQILAIPSEEFKNGGNITTTQAKVILNILANDYQPNLSKEKKSSLDNVKGIIQSRILESSPSPKVVCGTEREEYDNDSDDDQPMIFKFEHSLPKTTFLNSSYKRGADLRPKTMSAPPFNSQDELYEDKNKLNIQRYTSSPIFIDHSSGNAKFSKNSNLNY